MNEFSQLFETECDGGTIRLSTGKTYHVRPEDSFALMGYYCSNTADISENPKGDRCAAGYLKDKRAITVEGNGATLLIHGKMTPFVFDRCENVTVRDLTVDYACPTMTEFTVLSNVNGVCEIRIRPDCRFRVEGSSLFWRGEDGPDGLPYWEDESNGDHRFVKYYDPVGDHFHEFDRRKLTFTEIGQLDDRTLRVTLADPSAPLIPGCTFQTRNIIRDQTGAMCQRCKDLRFEGLRVKFMHGLGMVCQFCENVTFAGCDFTPAEGRVVASTADFFQFSGCRGQITVENCKAKGAHDDYVNVHGTHLRAMEIGEDKKSLTVRFMHHETWGLQAFETGDRIEFIRWDTLRPYGEATVTGWERRNDTDIRLTLDRPAPKALVLGKDVVENASWTPDVTVRGCDFGVTWGRGILCTTRGKVLIENNRFYHLHGPALLVEDDCNFWFESGYTRHIVFRNNEIIGCDDGRTGGGKAAVIRYSPKVMKEDSGEFVHGKLTVTGNTFREARDGYHALQLSYLAAAEIADNRCDAPLTAECRHCGEIRLTDNPVISPENL